MAVAAIQGSGLGTALQEMLLADDIEPGATPSYQLCKTIYLFHPLGAKMAEGPIRLAQSQPRDVSVQDAPKEVLEEFLRWWVKMGCDRHIFNVARTSRIYGIATVVFGDPNDPTDVPIDPWVLWTKQLYFNVFDPLNTAGSLVLNQDPNSPDFQKVAEVTVQGKTYHRSRSCVVMNESPIYISYSQSAFGYTGRSCYQRALFPMKSFVQTMITDDLVTRKAGVIVAKMKQAGSIVNNLMMKIAGVKRALLKEAEATNVISIDIAEDIMSLDLTNIDGSMTTARKNILENIAAAAPMPAKIILQETFAEGFGEGTEDAKHVAQYIQGMREELDPTYTWFDRIVQHVAWNPDFYVTIQNKYPEYQTIPYTVAFYRWQRSFFAPWPNLLIEPESERIKVDQTKLESVIKMIEAIKPDCGPENKVRLIQWACDNFNQNELLFNEPLVLDWDEFREFAEKLQEQADTQAQQPPPMVGPDGKPIPPQAGQEGPPGGPPGSEGGKPGEPDKGPQGPAIGSEEPMKEAA